MGKRNKDFEKWEHARSPVSSEEVRKVIEEIFPGRIKMGSGSSHLYKVQVPELKGNGDAYNFGLITVPLKGGQKVIAVYLRHLYQAAVQLELYPVPDEDNQPEEADKNEK